MTRVWVVVVGDVGRSPRMQYHTRSLCESGFTVDLVGQQGSPIMNELQTYVQSGKLSLHYLPEIPSVVQKIPLRTIRLALKALYQLVTLAWLTWVALPKPTHILLQIPPAVPTMMVLRGAALLRRAQLLFDWHNFAYTIMALSLGSNSSLVQLAKRYEKRWAHTASANFCVSKAMADALRDDWGVKANVLYDRPNDAFKRAGPAELHALLLRHRAAFQSPLHINDWFTKAMLASADSKGTPFTTKQSSSGGGAVYKASRPALVVSSTSWTDDEDFYVLLMAAKLYDQRAVAQAKDDGIPNIVFVITGKGPNQAIYEAELRRQQFKHVAFRLAWLPVADYRLLLGCADLGVSLHTSSSGVDLPMKVVDMFGAGLPVLSADYPAISELVKAERNGLLFDTPEALAGHLVAAFHGWGKGNTNKLLTTLREGAMQEAQRDWRSEWENVALPVLQGRQTGRQSPPPTSSMPAIPEPIKMSARSSKRKGR